MSVGGVFFSYPHGVTCFFFQPTCCRHDVVLSQHVVCTRPTDAKNARMVCDVASNAVIVGRLICEKQGAAGTAILGMKLILMNRESRSFSLAYGTPRVSRSIDRSTGFLWLV